MTAIEERLRADLQELALHLVPGQDAQPRPMEPAEVNAAAAAGRPGRRLLATLIVLTVGAIGIGTLWSRGGGSVRTATEPQPPAATTTGPSAADGAGSADGRWAPMAQAPILPRAHAVAAWTGGEVVFWAGSNLDRNFAYADGAAYDPSSDSWRPIPVPGWGHPGLTSAYTGGRLYVIAKGGVTSFDPESGIWTELPSPDGLVASGVVAGGDTVWAVGAVRFESDVQPNLVVAKFDQKTQQWGRGPVFEGSAGDAPAVDALTRLEREPIWMGPEIVVWGGSGGGLAYNTDTETWRRLAAPEPSDGTLINSTAVMTNSGLVLIASVETLGRTTVSMATLVDGTWVWSDAAALPIEGLDTLTVASTGDWLMLLRPEGPPIIVDARSGNWTLSDKGPLAGVEGASTVWTGSQLVIWGGVATPVTGGDAPSIGAVWTPPSVAPSPPSGASQSPAEATRDGVVAEVAALGIAERVSQYPERVGPTRIETPEGIWLISAVSLETPDLEQGCIIGDSSGVYGRDFICVNEYREVLLLDRTTGEIIRGYPFPSVPPQSLLLTDGAVYCLSQGDGGAPTSMLCRIDRRTLSATVRVFPVDSGSQFGPEGDQFIPDNWAIAQPGLAGFDRMTMLAGELRVASQVGSARVDADSLEILEVSAQDEFFPAPDSCRDASHVTAVFVDRLPAGTTLLRPRMILSRDVGLESWFFMSAIVVGSPSDGALATWALPAFDGVNVDTTNTPNLAVPINEAAKSLGFGMSLAPNAYGVDDWFQLDGALESQWCARPIVMAPPG